MACSARRGEMLAKFDIEVLGLATALNRFNRQDSRMSTPRATSIKDVAAHAGVSVGTVSNVLNGSTRVSPEAADRVRAAIDELRYVRNDAARQLRAGRSSTVGLVVLDVRNPFFTDVARGAEDEAAKHGLSVILGNSDENATREAGRTSTCSRSSGCTACSSRPTATSSRGSQRLRERGVPVVLVDRESRDAALSSVSVDDVAGGRLAVEHLLATGRRRIAFVGGAARHPSGRRPARGRPRRRSPRSGRDPRGASRRRRSRCSRAGDSGETVARTRTSAPTRSSPRTTSSPSGCSRRS